jgi:hypothetical protein
MVSIRSAIGVIVVGSTCAAASGQFVAYSQQPDIDNNQLQRGTVSEGVPGGFFDQRVADNFSLSGDVPLDSIRFWGHDEGFFSDDFPGNVAGVRVELFADAGGAPAATPLLAINADLADPELTATEIGVTNLFGAPVAVFDLDVSMSNLTLTAGDYWLSVAGLFNVSPANADSFVWAGADDVNNVRALEEPVDSGFGVESGASLGDYAFEIVGIPSPSAVGVLAVAGAAGLRRRR